MRCKKCQSKAIIKIPRHHAAFCKACFFAYFQNQVERAISEWRMFSQNDKILVAVSGGKDSLALWDVLLDMGYRAEGLYVHLGIGDYSGESRGKAEVFAVKRGVPLRVADLPSDYSGGIPEIAEDSSRSPCSACGTVKRYLFNRIATEAGYDVVATGHNLDDEASRLFGNLLQWQTDYLAQQLPVLPASHPKLTRKVKPLFRLAEREIAAYAFLKGIDYIVEECPMSVGAKQLVYKELLNRLEEESPGSKQTFYWKFLKDGYPVFEKAETGVSLRECSSCGQVTTGEVCSFCRLTGKIPPNPPLAKGGWGDCEQVLP
ncbi:MAG: adenine nucleotide alpha hydrolase family protein [Nitrospirae bacterium]|nr:adenine nucleotide alpha hydrolase family protein [Nitrospirota bacterium]